MKKLLSLSLLFLFSTSFAFAGSLTPMDKSAASAELSDKTITTISAATLNGKVISDSFTGYFSKDGKAKGRFVTKPAEGPDADEGTWKVNADGKVCVTWNHWNHGKGKCVNFYKLSNALLIVNANNGFESLVLTRDIKSGNQL